MYNKNVLYFPKLLYILQIPKSYKGESYAISDRKKRYYKDESRCCD